VDVFAATVVAAAGVALGVLVREHRALGLQHRDGYEVLARDHLEVVALASEFELEDFGDLGIDLGQRGVQHRLLGNGGFGQDWLLHDMRTCWVLPAATRAETCVPAQAYGRSVPVAPRW